MLDDILLYYRLSFVCLVLGQGDTKLDRSPQVGWVIMRRAMGEASLDLVGGRLSRGGGLVSMSFRNTF